MDDLDGIKFDSGILSSSSSVSSSVLLVTTVTVMVVVEFTSAVFSVLESYE